MGGEVAPCVKSTTSKMNHARAKSSVGLLPSRLAPTGSLRRLMVSATCRGSSARVCHWHIAADVVAALKVRYGAGSSAATYLGECPES